MGCFFNDLRVRESAIRLQGYQQASCPQLQVTARRERGVPNVELNWRITSGFTAALVLSLCMERDVRYLDWRSGNPDERRTSKTRAAENGDFSCYTGQLCV